MTRFFLSFLFFCAAWVLPAQAMTVEEAYASIPHQRTPFSPAASRLSPAQADALARLFALSDRATVLRVQGLQALHFGDSPRLRGLLPDYRALLSDFQSLPSSEQTQAASGLVRTAIEQHRKFFETRLQAGSAGGGQATAFTPDVYQASEKLKQAYGLLMTAFPKETAGNRQAFFDHLCALDFL